MNEDISFLLIQAQQELKDMKSIIAGQLNEDKLTSLMQSIQVLRDIADDMEEWIRSA